MGAGDSLGRRMVRRVRRAMRPPPARPDPPMPVAQAVTELRWTYDSDGLKTIHNCDFLEDPLFQEAYRLGSETDSWYGFDIRWRAYVVCWAAEKGRTIEGDYVECGVNK